MVTLWLFVPAVFCWLATSFPTSVRWRVIGATVALLACAVIWWRTLIETFDISAVYWALMAMWATGGGLAGVLYGALKGVARRRGWPIAQGRRPESFAVLIAVAGFLTLAAFIGSVK